MLLDKVVTTYAKAHPKRKTALVLFCGTDTDHRFTVSSSKEKKDADSGERGAQREKGSKDKLVRLDYLLPDEKVVGGQQLFGVSDATQNQKTN